MKIRPGDGFNRPPSLRADQPAPEATSAPPPPAHYATGSETASKPEIHRLLRQDPKLPGVRVRELLEPLGCIVCKTVVDDYLREVRPLFAPSPRTFQRTVYRPGEIVQFDVWEPAGELPVGHGQTRRGFVVIACLGYSRAGADRGGEAPRPAAG